MHFDAVGPGIEVDPPHRLQESGARNRPVRDARKIGEQVELAQRAALGAGEGPDAGGEAPRGAQGRGMTTL